MIKELEIGNVKLENNILTAPMAGVSDLPFRIMCKKYGLPGLVYTEMISSRAMYHGDEKTKNLLNTKGEKRPITFQIFGSNPEIMAEAAAMIESEADIIDINMGCPAPKIVKNGDGSKLLQNLDLAGEIVRTVVNRVSKPVTVKIRKGWDNDNIVAVEAAKILEAAGASIIAVHGRTRDQFYSGQVDREIIRKVKEAVNIPVIGNGDIRTPKDAEKMFKETNVDGIMVRQTETCGNPWLTKRIHNYLTGVDNVGGDFHVDPIPNEEKLRVILEHLDLLIEEKGEYIAVREMRKHICWYTKNLKDSTKLRQELNKMNSRDRIEKMLAEYFENI